MNRLKLATYSLLGTGAFLALIPGQVHAACSQWDMPATMLINQSNDAVFTIRLSPVEGGFLGTAESRYDGLQLPGVLEGALEGSNVNFTIHWHAVYDFHRIPSRTGIYTGTVGPQGRLTGTAYKAENPTETATWWVEKVLDCRASAAITGTVQPKLPPTPLGRKQPTSPVPDPLERKQVPINVILAPPPICISAQNARGRNSPAAPNLERQCQIAMEQAAAAAR